MKILRFTKLFHILNGCIFFLLLITPSSAYLLILKMVLYLLYFFKENLEINFFDTNQSFFQKDNFCVR